MSRLDDTIQAKKEKRQSLEGLGVTIHPYIYDKTHSVAECLESEGKKVKTAGRIMSLRTHGNVIFIDLQDSTGRIQVLLHKDNLSEGFEALSFVDMGDYLGVTGEVSHTKTGEITIKATEYEFHGKALRPLPTAWNAADNKEVRFRKRYLDLLVNPNTKRVLDARWLILKEIRRFLEDKHNFIEVETPVLQPLYGGTNATPFTTHMNSLDTDFYLRVAPELYLKRLIVGGYEKIFEIARNFRNEGIDQTHQPEFTMIEWYHAYADYHVMMDVAEELVRHLVIKLNGNTKLQVFEDEVDVGDKWERITMLEAMKKYEDIDFESMGDDEVRAMMKEHKLELIGEYTRGKAMFSLFDNLVTSHLIAPTWIIDYPRDVSPLSKRHRDNKNLAERYECYIGGKELADGWSEIVDPIDQRNIWENEQKRMRSGDSEAHPMDEDYLEAMDYGMPPLGGIGMGIDRLVMFLTNTWSIKEVIAFPTLRPLRTVVQEVSAKTNIKKELMPDVDNANESQEEIIVETKAKKAAPREDVELPSRLEAEALVKKYIKNEKLSHHCFMVGQAMEAYAKELGEDSELWYQTGLLHDLDWEMFPDEHPNKAVADIINHYPQIMLDAINAHAPARTGKHPKALIERYLFACDELSGLMHAVSLMRPNGFSDMKTKSVKKKIKDKSFAANVSRDDIRQGFELIGKTPDEHIGFLIEVFRE
jgi:lysyl-tRNA synthetase, class II